MIEIEVTVRPAVLPDGPRGTMARLRGKGRFALLESAMPMPRRAQWSYIAGPALATLCTDERSTRLERDGREIASWADPFEALAAVATGAPDRVRFDGECPEGMDFVGGWVGVLGYDLARQIERLPELARCDPALPRQWWMAVDQVLGFHHPSGQWWQATVRGPRERWPWSRDHSGEAWDLTLAWARGPLPERGHWHAGPRCRKCRMSALSARSAKREINEAPLPTPASAQMRPPCPRTIRCTVASPIRHLTSARPRDSGRLRSQRP